MAAKQESVALITDHLSDVREKYHIQPKELGHGHYGVVRKCQERNTGEWFAIKSIRKKKVGKLDVLKREIDILKEVRQFQCSPVLCCVRLPLLLTCIPHSHIGRPSQHH